MRKANLMLHCGSSRVTRDQMREVKTPLGTDTHKPIPHTLLWDKTLSAFEDEGYELVNEAHALNVRDEQDPEVFNHYFGLMQLAPKGHDGAAWSSDQEYALIAGVRNAHDKRFPAAIAAGANLFVCDNLAFHGEVHVSRRHTKNIFDDLDGVIDNAVTMFNNHRDRIPRRHEAYQEALIPSQRHAHDIVVRAWREHGAIPKTAADHVLDEYDNPSHEDHTVFDMRGRRSLWRLYNAFTEALKGRGRTNRLGTLAERTMNLHGLLDAEAETLGGFCYAD